ncbi:MAG: glycosyltransferase [Anaerolineaceae bacterium]|nr:glycosyltransferase [Anaerolineaceae bacterium]
MAESEIVIQVIPFSKRPHFTENASIYSVPSEVRVDLTVARKITREFAESWQVLPLQMQGKVLLAAFVNTADGRGIRALMQATGMRIRPVQVTVADLQQAIAAVFADRGETEHLPIGQILLRKRLIREDQLEEALEAHQRTGERLGKVLVSLGFINRLSLAEVLADQYHVSFINLRTEKLDPNIIRLLDDSSARDWQCLPVKWIGSHLLVAIADPSQEEIKQQVMEKLRVPVIFAVTSEFDIDWALDRVYRATYLEESIAGLLYRNPDESAFQTFTNQQLLLTVALLAAVIVCALLVPRPFFIAFNAFFGVFYLAVTIYRLWLATRSSAESLTIQVTKEDIDALDDADLPVYTIMIPVFREKEVLKQLIHSVESFNYPKEKLDVKLLFEESDKETIQAAREIHPPGYFEFLVVPDAIPRTKPKALNYGLVSARGIYTVVYDAEDVPDPDQLKQAVLAFRRADPNVVCLQAKLNYYNANQNLLTRWFTIEYSMWFDLVLPGLDSTNVPIPLGGTSNHFLTEKLRELGAWDPFNVTEDADLGMRMYKRNYRTAIVDSTTYEEANSEIWNWIRQRTRWEKGYMQTWLVAMHHPVQLFRSLGLKAFLSFQITIGGSPLILLINPVYWIITTLWFVGQWKVIPDLFPGPIYYLSMFNMLSGNFLFIYMNLLGTYRRKYYDLGRYALLTPIYWFLMSIAAWRALWQLVTRPFYWEKTVHGLHIDAQKMPAKSGLLNRLLRGRQG